MKAVQPTSEPHTGETEATPMKLSAALFVVALALAACAPAQAPAPSPYPVQAP